MNEYINGCDKTVDFCKLVETKGDQQKHEKEARVAGALFSYSDGKPVIYAKSPEKWFRGLCITGKSIGTYLSIIRLWNIPGFSTWVNKKFVQTFKESFGSSAVSRHRGSYVTSCRTRNTG